MSATGSVDLTPKVKDFFHRVRDKLERDYQNCKLPEFHQHFVQSRDAIAKAIAGRHNSAWILGAGSLNDLPIRALAEQFDQVVLVDINTYHSRRALKHLPKEVQQKFVFRQMDLTGIFVELVEGIDQLVQQDLPHEEFVCKVLEFLPTLKKGGLNFEEHPDFVCSSLVGSQLGGEIFHYIEKTSKEIYGKSFELSPEKQEAFDAWGVSLQTDHLEDIHRLVDPNGLVYFADHYSAKGVLLTSCEIEVCRHELGEAPFAGAKTIQDYMLKRFSVLHHEICGWGIPDEIWGWGVPVNRSVQYMQVQNADGSIDDEQIPVDVLELREYQVSSFMLSPIHQSI